MWMKDILKRAVETFPPMVENVRKFNEYLRQHGSYMPNTMMLELVKNNAHDREVLLESVRSPLYNFDVDVSLERIFALLGSSGVKNILVAEFIRENFKFDILPRDEKGNRKAQKLKCLCDTSPYGLDGETFLQECQKEIHFIASWIFKEDKKLHVLLPALMLLRLGIIVFSQVLIINDLQYDFYNELADNDFSNLLAIEKKYLGMDHIEFLEYLMRTWQTDPYIIEGVHHLKKPHLAPQNSRKSAYLFAIVEKIFTPHHKVSKVNVMDVLELMQKIQAQGVKFNIEIFKSAISKEYYMDL